MLGNRRGLVPRLKPLLKPRSQEKRRRSLLTLEARNLQQPAGLRGPGETPWRATWGPLVPPGTR
eukprot:12719109-Alexandrium_andersonii.AAC.1